MRRDGVAASSPLTALSDSALRSAERRLRLDIHTNAHFVPRFPLRVMQAIVEAEAEAALPLVLAIHRQLSMTRRDETPLNAAIWEAAGSPSPRRRETILRKLKPLPDVIEIHYHRSIFGHYRVRKGRLWRGE